MRKLFLAFVCLLGVETLFSQETQVHSNPLQKFEDGKALFVQKKYGASKKAFEEFLKVYADKKSGYYVDAAYYIATLAYELGDPQTVTILDSFVKQYPYYPMRSRVAFLLGKYYFEKQRYKMVSSSLAAVSPQELNREDAEEYYLMSGFCKIQKGEYQEAKGDFMRVNYSNKYIDERTYYIAYCNYVLGQYDAALNGFEHCNMTKYEEPALYHSLQIYEQQGNTKKAVSVGETLIERYPNNQNNSEAYRIIGESYYKDRKYQIAVEKLKKYEQLAPKVQREDMYILGMSLYNTNQTEEAIKYLSKTTNKADATAENAYFSIGQCYIRLNDMSQAKMAFNSAYNIGIDKKIKEEALYNYVIATYKTTAAFGETTKAFNKYLTEYPSSTHSEEVTELLASAYMTAGNYEEALRSINSMRNPSQKIIQAKEYVLFRLGVQQFNDQRFADAKDYFSQSISLHNAQSISNQALLYRGETYFRLKQYGLSRTDLESFIAKSADRNHQDYAKALYTIGYTYFAENTWDKSITYFTKYSQAETNKKSELFYDAQARLGDCYYYKRNFNTASNYYSKILSSSSSSADYAMYQKAFIKGLQKDYTGEISDMRKLVSSYPSSVYSPQAQYEIGRAFVVQNKYSQAIVEYNTLLEKYPQNTLAKKAILEIGMLYENMGESLEAISAYKKVVEKYPGSEQANVALESMQNLYVEKNDVASYSEYLKSLGSSALLLNVSKEDSLSYIAAEKVYAKGDYKNAVVALTDYLNRYCSESNSLNCINATYYLADSHYEVGDMPKALDRYKALSMLDGNKYQEQSLVRAADIAFSEKKFDEAAECFKKLKQVTSNNEVKQKSQLGVLRCYYQGNQHEFVVDNATLLLSSPVSADIEREARYCRMKSLMSLDDVHSALPDMNFLKAEAANYEVGAEASYHLAYYYFRRNEPSKSEEEIVAFIEKQSPFEYWIARSFVLMADIYIKQKDYFQAKQYLLTLQENYQGSSEIDQMIKTRLSDIDAHYKEEVI